MEIAEPEPVEQEVHHLANENINASTLRMRIVQTFWGYGHSWNILYHSYQFKIEELKQNSILGSSEFNVRITSLYWLDIKCKILYKLVENLRLN